MDADLNYFNKVIIVFIISRIQLTKEVKMDSMEKVIIRKSEAQLILDALEFTANNVEFKNAHYITGDKIASVSRKIKEQFNKKPKISKPKGIFDITNGWK
jgi:hypothetical protein